MPAARKRPGCWFLLAGIGVTPYALMLAFISTGAGHGDYILATVLCPYSMLFVPAAGHDFREVLIDVLAILQFPLYGFILELSAARGRLGFAAVALLALHSITVALAFSIRPL